MKKKHFRTEYSLVHPHWALLQLWQHFFRCTKALFFITVHHAKGPSILILLPIFHQYHVPTKRRGYRQATSATYQLLTSHLPLWWQCALVPSRFLQPVSLIPQLIRIGLSHRSIFGQAPLQLGSLPSPINSPLPIHRLPPRGP